MGPTVEEMMAEKKKYLADKSLPQVGAFVRLQMPKLAFTKAGDPVRGAQAGFFCNSKSESISFPF